MDSESGSRPVFFSNGVTTACFITFGTVDDSIDRFTMRVSTGASVPMFALSNVVGITSMSGENVLDPFITRLLTSSLVASVKSHNGSSMTQSMGSNTNVVRLLVHLLDHQL